MPAGQRGVATQRDLQLGRKPAQFEIGLGAVVRHKERGFRQVVVGRDALKHTIRQPTFEKHHRRRITSEGTIGKGINLRERQAHQG